MNKAGIEFSSHAVGRVLDRVILKKGLDTVDLIQMAKAVPIIYRVTGELFSVGGRIFS